MSGARVATTTVEQQQALQSGDIRILRALGIPPEAWRVRRCVPPTGGKAVVGGTHQHTGHGQPSQSSFSYAMRASFSAVQRGPLFGSTAPTLQNRNRGSSEAAAARGRCIPAAEIGDNGRPNGSMNSAHDPVALGTVPSRSLMV